VANHVKRLAIVERDFFQVGEIEEVLTEKNLSSLYNLPLRVSRLEGSTVIHTGGRRG
jgi:hypothetical protein